MHQHIERRAGLRDRQVRSPPSDFAIDTAQGRALAVVVPMLVTLALGLWGIRRKEQHVGRRIRHLPARTPQRGHLHPAPSPLPRDGVWPPTPQGAQEPQKAGRTIDGHRTWPYVLIDFPNPIRNPDHFSCPRMPPWSTR